MYKPATGLLLVVTALLAILLAIAACGDSTDGPPSPTPQSVLFATPPVATSTGADDQPDPGIVVQLDSTPTPYPTATPYPIPPSTTGSATGPAVSIEIPTKADLKYPEVGSKLNDIVSRVEAGEISAEEAASEAPIHRGDSVGVIILLSGNVDGVVRFLKNNGGANVRAGGDYIEAYVPVLLLVETSQQPGVLQVRLIQPPGETQGTPQVVGNGPAVHGSPSWNQAGYTGRGIKVGVIDVGFWGLEDILGAELPAVVQARCYTYVGQHTQNLSDCGNGGVTHGTEVSESVMDIAPEVSLYISDPQSKADLRDAVDWMISEGVSVINHSALWSFDGPGDGSSPLSISPLNTIDTAVAAGIIWVSAAGNQARGAWFKRNPDFTTVSGEAYKLLRFSGSNTINAQSYIGGPLELRWEDEWGRAETDLDLLVYEQGNDEIWLQSRDTQSGSEGHFPYESVSGRGPVDILIVHRGGPDPDWIQLVGWRQTRLTLNSSGAGSIINPAESANPGMLAVGAAPWGDVNSIESYSSRGPTPDGRVKPDVVGADCGETATESEPFCGTSQAAPHVAGMAALVRQRFPDYTPAQVVSYLKENAQQRISSPDPNDTWGHGFLVLPPVTQQPPPPTISAPGSVTITSVTPDTNSLTVFWHWPSDTGGSSSLSFDLRYIRSDAFSKADANWTLKRQANVTSQGGRVWHMLTDLTGGTPHDVQVRAVNSAGEGPWSATVTGTPTSPTLSSDATLSALTVIPVVIGFHLSVTTYHVGVANDVSRVTVVPVARDAGATVRVDGTVLSRGSSRAVFLNQGSNAITFTVTAGDGKTTKTYTVTIDRGSDDPFGWKVTDDFQLDLPSGFSPRGLWSNGAAFYTACATSNANIGASLCAFNLTDQWDTYHTLATHGNNSPTGIWSDGTTMYVADANDKRIYAYKTASYFRDTRREVISLSDHSPGGLWGQGFVLWVADSSDDKLYAYDLISGEQRASFLHFDNLGAAGNSDAKGLWSDGTTMWVADSSDAKLYAYDVGTKLRAPAKDFDTLAAVGNRSPWGIWSDGVTMWVADSATNRIFSYNMPPKSALGPLTGPGAPRNLRATPRDGTSIGLSWSPPSSDGGSSITAYDLRHIRSDATNKGDANWTVVQDVWTGSGARSYELADLDGGTQYDVQVRAVNAAGDGPWSATATGTPTSAETTPGSPANAQYERVGTTTLVTWDPSTGATHYKLYHSDSRFPRCSLFSSGSTSGCDELAANVAATTYEHTSPDADTNNYWITACNAAGCSEIDSGNPARFVDSRPAAPTGAQYVRVGSTAVVTWDQSTGATHYKLYYDDFFGTNCRLSSGSPSFCELLAGNVAGATYTHTSPDDDTNYYWITACNSAGCSDIDSGNPAQFTATQSAATAPGAPTGLTATANGQSRIDLSWTAPSDDGGSNITGYKIEVSTNGSTRSDLVANTNSTSTSYSHTSLTAGSTRHYRVSAINSVGTGTASNVDNATTSLATQGSPDLVVDNTLLGAKVTPGYNLSLKATVSNQGDGPSVPTTLRYYHSPDAMITTSDTQVGTDRVDRLVPSSSIRHAIAVTVPSTPGTYYYGACVDTVPSESDAGNNCSTATVVTVGAATAPDLVVDSPTVDTSAPAAGARFTLSATVRNQGNGSSAATTLRYYQSTDSTITTGDTEVGTDSVSGLNSSGSGDESISLDAPSTPGTYYFGGCVDAVIGESDTTNNCSSAEAVTVLPASGSDLVIESFRILSIEFYFPLLPMYATVRNQGTGSSAATPVSFYLSTDATISTSDTRIDGQYVRRLAPSETSGYGAVQVTTTAQSIPGTYYYGACVQTVSGETDTTNNCSAAVAVTVGDVDTAPAAPTGLSATADGQTEIDLLWTAPSDDGGANITGYRIEVSTNGSSWTDLVTNTGNTIRSYSHTGLTAGSTRHYRVSAINSAGTSTASNVDNATTSLATQGSPDLVVDNTLLGANVTPGYNLSLKATVSNQGDGPSVPTTLRYYHSPDAMITTSDTQVGTDRVDRLVPSGSIRHAIAVTVPSTPGTYYYGACVDTVPSESDAGNNCSTATEVTVRVVNRPPQVVGDIDDMTVTLGEFFQVDISGVFSEHDGEDVQNYGFTLRTKGILSGTVHTLTGILNLRAIGVGATTVAVEASDIHGNGSGPHDLFVVTVVPAETTTAPDAPTGLTATADGQTEIDLSWTAPSDDGGASITGYRIEVSTDGSSWSDLVTNTNSTSTSYSHTGLAAGSARHYRVSAINSAWTGTASNVDNATTDTAPPPAPDGTCSVDLVVSPGESCTYPGTSTEFSVASDGTGQFLFTSSGSKIELRNTTINGVTYTFVASKQSDGNWRVEEVG